MFTVVLLVALLSAVGVYGAAIASTVAYGVALAMMLLSLRGLPIWRGPDRHHPGARCPNTHPRRA